MAEGSATRYQRVLTEFNSASEQGGHRFRISLMRVDTYLVLRLEGAVVQSTSVTLVDKLKPVLADQRTGDLIVDLSMCEQMNSAALGMVAFTSLEVSRRGGKVYLVKPKPQVASMLKVLGADKAMIVVDAVDTIIG